MSIKENKTYRDIRLIAASLLGAIFLTLWSACGEKATRTPPPPPKVTVVQPVRKSVIVDRPASTMFDLVAQAVNADGTRPSGVFFSNRQMTWSTFETSLEQPQLSWNPVSQTFGLVFIGRIGGTWAQHSCNSSGDAAISAITWLLLLIRSCRFAGVSAARILPSNIMTMRLQVISASGRMWVESKTVRSSPSS